MCVVFKNVESDAHKVQKTSKLVSNFVITFILLKSDVNFGFFYWSVNKNTDALIKFYFICFWKEHAALLR